MRATVTTAYTDRLDGSVHLPGEVVDLTEARCKELSEGGYVKAEKRPTRAWKAASK